MGVSAWVAPGMAAALLGNMPLPAKDHGRLPDHQATRRPGGIMCCRTFQERSL
jgi:hypothetical protein